jgi:hypothetical protein
MPASYSIDPARRMVFSRGWGDLTDADLVGHQVALLADSAFDPSFAQLGDMREITDESRVTALGVRYLAGHDVFTPWARRAFVAPRPMSFQLARFFALLRTTRGDHAIEVFQELSPARLWVGLTDWS